MTWENMEEFIPPKDLDPECLEVCQELNKLEGIRTTGSCCGHNRQHFRVFLDLNLKTWGHKVLTRCVCDRYYESGWSVELTHSDVEPFTGFLLSGPIDASQGDVFATRIRKVIAHPAVSKLFGIDLSQ